jgi:apolipoprotein N-acyltransferase
MPESSTAAAVQERSAPAAMRDRGPHPALLAVGSALLLWLAFPPADRGYLAWFALVPLLLLVRSERRARAIYSGAWLGGLVFWLLAIEWVRLTDPSAWLAWVVMAVFLSLWWPGFVLLARLAVRRLGLPLMIAAPVLWVALEFVRAHALTGFPWYYLAHTQYRALPLIQICDVTGVWGLSLLVALVNAWILDLLTTPLLRPTPRGPRPTREQSLRGAVVLGALVLVLSYGGMRLATARFRPGPRLALLQSNIRQELKMKSDGQEILAEYDALAARALRGGPRPDLIVWPETSYPYVYSKIEPTLDDATLTRHARTVDPKATAGAIRLHAQAVSRSLHDRADAMGVPIVVGAIVADYSRAGRVKYNTAILVEPGRAAEQRYDKLHLVPFGEYVPLIQTLPWLTRLTPYHGELVPSLAFGVRPVWFDLGRYRYATAICFEDTVPHVVRRFFREMADGRPPDVLLNISNDGWFQGSSELNVHLVASVFRCVENRVPLARAVNTGISAIVDGNGAILHGLPKLASGVLSEVVPLDDRVAPYTAWGDWLAWTCLAVGIGLVPLAFLKHRTPVRVS